MPERLRLLEDWLEQSCRIPQFEISPASADASFRRYFRVALPDGRTWVAMDAPPEKEDCRPFVEVAGRMRQTGLHVPQIIAQDLAQGFLLMEDLGSRDYLDVLTADTAESLYADAIAALLRLQSAAPVAGLPAYDHAMLLREMQLFRDWLLSEHLAVSLDPGEQGVLETAFDCLIENALAQPLVCVHRDFHSRNLMLVDVGNPGVIDFQDAVAGPISYDLVSLLRDCYVRWPTGRVDRWVADYYRAARSAALLEATDESTFREWFDLMGVQRHLKAAGIFARLNHRDGKSGYLADIPRTLGYIVEVGRRVPSMQDLGEFVGRRVLPRL